MHNPGSTQVTSDVSLVDDAGANQSPSHTKRIGLVTLATDLTMERDFRRMVGNLPVNIYVSRVENHNPTTKENLLAMQPRLSEAASLILPNDKLDSLGYGCTAASALIGDSNVVEALQVAKPNTACATPASGAITGFKKLGTQKISILAPYSKVVSESLADYYSQQGLDVVSLHYMGINDDTDIARVSAKTIINCVDEIILSVGKSTEALFLSCTALPALDLIEQLENRTGLPVVTSNQALFWQCVRLAKVQSEIPGFGKLLRQPG